MADKGNNWDTGITEIASNLVRVRGYRVDELMGRFGFAAGVYLLATGELPDRAGERLLDAILISSIDHGAATPSTLAARTATSTGAPLNGAAAAGILSINEFHGGAIEACMGFLRNVADLESYQALTTENAADRLVADLRAAGRRLSGFGHRIHSEDPRALRLFELAAEIGVSGRWIARARALEVALERETGRMLKINVDGAIAASLLEIGVPPEFGNGLFMIARLPGLIAQSLEESATQRRMRRIDPGGMQYCGSPPRAVDQGSVDTAGDARHPGPEDKS